MNRAGCTLSLIVSTLIASNALGQELPFVHYTVHSELNPLPSAAVNEVIIDSQGFLWFVIHSSGLFRYDGHTSEVYSAKDGLPANSTIDMVEDQKGPQARRLDARKGTVRSLTIRFRSNDTARIAHPGCFASAPPNGSCAEILCTATARGLIPLRQLTAQFFNCLK